MSRSTRSFSYAWLALSLVLAVPAPAQKAEQMLASMTIEEKAGQLFMNWILARADGPAREQMRTWIADVGLGGVVLSLGNARQAKELIDELQAAAAVPLIIAGDFEGGVAFRLQGTTDMGNQMLVGATGSVRLARALGEITAAEGVALGYHWAFAPVLDVNVNPRNPIINVRSFGEDPAQVARLGAAVVQGLQARGLLACGKHFPGHGDVASDSHLEMPTVPGDRTRLEDVELRPFRAAIAAGLGSIMTGHLAVPGLGEQPGVPATLSRKILTGVLREDMGFSGVVVTDALDMGGVKNAVPPEEVAIRALQAGADMLLMPPDPVAARDALVAAVRGGRLAEADVDRAALNILRAKERVGLLASDMQPDLDWRETLSRHEHRAMAAEIAARGLTGVRDADGLLPLVPPFQPLAVRAPAPGRPAIEYPDATAAPCLNGVVERVDVSWPEGHAGAPIVGVMRHDGVDWYVHADGSQSTSQMVDVRPGTERQAVGLAGVPDGPPRGTGTLLVSLLDKDQEAVGDVLRAELEKGLPGIDAVRVHPGSGAEAIAAAAKQVAAAKTVVCALYVKVRSYSGHIGVPPALAPVVDALAAAPRAVAVSFGNPYLVEAFPAVSTYLCAYAGTEHTERAVAAALLGRTPVTGRLPVGIPEVAPRGTGLSYLPGTAIGRAAPSAADMDPGLPQAVRELLENAVADRAFPGAVCMVARRGRIVGEVAVGRYSYDPEAPPVDVGALFDLASLTKVCATAPAVLRLAAAGVLSLDTRVQDLVPEFTGPGKDAVTVRHLLTHSSGLPAYVRFFRSMKGKEAIVAAAAREGLRTEPGTAKIYSDLGLILLMACVEKATGERFEEVVQRQVFGPLGITGAQFNTTDGPLAAVPTEEDAWRGSLVQGFVHDENAYAMGGVSGHAGLFARAEDVLRIGLAYLGGGRGWLPAELAREATRPANVVPGSSRGLGWDTLRSGGWGGSDVPPGVFGHTGFTGTSVWCDPSSDLCVVLLTNRVHPTRVNAKITGVRRQLHDLVRGALR